MKRAHIHKDNRTEGSYWKISTLKIFRIEKIDEGVCTGLVELRKGKEVHERRPGKV